MGMADYILGTYLYHCNALLVTAISVIRSEKKILNSIVYLRD